MRRFIPGWKVLGYARRFEAEIVNYADDFAVLGRAPAAVMLAAVETLLARLKLPMNAEKTRCCRLPEASMTFLGYRIGRNYRRDTGRAYIGTRPSQSSVQSICRRVSELTTRRNGPLSPPVVVARINRLLTGWANYFTLGQVSPAYAAIDQHAPRRLRQWLCRKHKVQFGKYVRFPDERLWQEYGLTRLVPRTASFPWARHDLVREPDAGNPPVRLCVQPRLACSAGDKSRRGKNQEPRSLDSWEEGNRFSEAYRQGLPWGDCESSGRNVK